MESKRREQEKTAELTEKEYWFWLDSLKGIGREKRKKLLDWFGTTKAVFLAKREELEQIPGLGKVSVEALTDEKGKEALREEYDKMRQKGIRLILKGEEEYPEKLKYIYDSPDALYVRGRLPSPEKKAIAIVGARNASSYGLEMAEQFGRELSLAGVEIISGLARGIDSAAHRGALASNFTYGVLGCGIDRCYPMENLELFMEMEKKGGVISEFGIGVHPKAGNFPLRNRIISGLCDGVLVVEAKEKSGSLITAQLGLEQGKDIFAMPGRGCDILSRGCNHLIKQGAFLADTPEDILDFYQIDMKKIWEEDKKNKKFLDLKWEMVYSGLSLEPKHICTIMEEADMSLADTMETLLSLEMRGYVKKVDRNYYILCN